MPDDITIEIEETDITVQADEFLPVTVEIDVPVQVIEVEVPGPQGPAGPLMRPALPFGIHRALSLHATTRCALMMAGDSRPEGTGKATIAETYRYLYQQALRTLYNAWEDKGRGYIPVVYNNGSAWAEAPVPSGSPTTRNAAEGLGLRSVQLNNTGDMYTWQLHGTHMVLCYASYGGATSPTSEYRITPVSTGIPGSWVTVTHSPGSGFDYREEISSPITLGAEGDYIVEWRFKANGTGIATKPVIEGIIEINGDPTKGIVVLDAAHGGITTTGYVGNSKWAANFGRQVTLHGAKGLLVDILTNDWQTGQVTPAQSKDNLQKLVSTYQAVQDPADPYSDVVFMAGWKPRAPLGTPVAPWVDYRDRIYEIFLTNQFVHVLDMRRHLPDPDAPGDLPVTTSGYYDFLGIHPEEVGDQVISKAWLMETTPQPSSNYYPAAAGPSGATVPTYIQPTAPSPLPAKYAWWDTSGGNLTLWIEDGT